MSVNIGNKCIDEYDVVILSSIGQLIVQLGETLIILGESLSQEEANEEQLKIQLNLQLIEQALIEIMETQVIFLQKQIEKMSLKK